MNPAELKLLEKEIGFHLDRVKTLISIAVMRDNAPPEFGYRGISPLHDGSLQFIFQSRKTGFDASNFADFYTSIENTFGFYR